MPEMSLQRRLLGRSGIDVSILGLGTVKLGRNQGVKYPASFTLPDDRAARELLTEARRLGINLIDTAPAYGNSEERLGTLLKGERSDWVIASKVGEEFEAGESHFDFSPEHTRLSVERSLRRLATDYLDIVLVHSDGNDEHIIRDLGTLEALANLKQAGKIRAFGMSTKTVEGGLLAARHCDCLMVTWNLGHREETPVIDQCHRHGAGVLIKKVLDSGHMAEQQGSVADAFAELFRHPGVSSAIVGTINPEHLRSNVRAAIAATRKPG